MNRTITTLNGRRVVHMKDEFSEGVKEEITSMEYFDALLVDARESVTSLLDSGEGANKVTAKQALERSLKSYEKLLRTITPFTSEGWLRYYYAAIRDKASAEAGVLSKLAKGINASGSEFSDSFREYVSLLMKDR